MPVNWLRARRRCGSQIKRRTRRFTASSQRNGLPSRALGYVGATRSSGTHAIPAYSLTAGEDFPNRDPKNWRLEGSNNGSTWTACGTRNGVFTNRNETRSWQATNSTTFNAYRLNILTNNGGTEVQLSELRVYEFVPVLLIEMANIDDSGRATKVPSSGDGTKLVAVPLTGGSPFRWTNSGQSFFPQFTIGVWNCAAASLDGSAFICGTTFNNLYDNGVYISANFSAGFGRTSLPDNANRRAAVHPTPRG